MQFEKLGLSGTVGKKPQLPSAKSVGNAGFFVVPIGGARLLSGRHQQQASK
jgi:hypothetical protein